METATIRIWFDRFSKATEELVTHVQMYADTKAEYDSCAEYDLDGGKEWAVAPFGTVFSYESIPDELLDYEFSVGWGRPMAPCLIAWSDSFVIYIEEFDGLQNIRWVPRFPEQYKLQSKYF